MEIRYYETLASTNATAKDLARGGAPHGTVVLARSQTAGRGQHGRSFISPSGGIYLSLILRPELPPSKLMDLTALTGVAVCRSIKTVCPTLDPRIKPVNDVRINGSKVCGILVELSSIADRTDFAVLGIGVNVATIPPVSDQHVTSLEEAAGQAVALGVFRDELLTQLSILASFLDGAPGLEDWLSEYHTLLENLSN